MLLQGLTLSENEVDLEVMQYLVAPEFCKDYNTFVPLANILRCRHVAELQVFFLMSLRTISSARKRYAVTSSSNSSAALEV